MLHHRIQTDLKGVDACTPASVSAKSWANCRAFCEYDRMQEVAGCSRLHAGGCSLHAGFMQVAGCSILHAGCSRLHAGCMQPACISSVPIALQIYSQYFNIFIRSQSHIICYVKLIDPQSSPDVPRHSSCPNDSTGVIVNLNFSISFNEPTYTSRTNEIYRNLIQIKANIRIYR